MHCRCVARVCEHFSADVRPITFRIDLHISMARMDAMEVCENTPLGEQGASAHEQLEAAYARPRARGRLNAHLRPAPLRT